MDAMPQGPHGKLPRQDRNLTFARSTPLKHISRFQLLVEQSPTSDISLDRKVESEHCHNPDGIVGVPATERGFLRSGRRIT